MKKQILLFYILLCGIIYGQSANNYAPITYPTSPDVTKMQTYGQIPVTPYSGLANVSIPIYTIKEGDFEFPISLDYSSRGIKVQEEASRVGLGWSLGFPGLISRSINGQDDFIGGYGQLNGKYFNSRANDGASYVPDLIGYYAIPTDYLKLGLDTRLWPTDYKLENYIQADRIKDNTDFQPDDYFYNLPNYSGRFIFKRNKTAVLEKIQDNLKIEILDSLNNVGQPTMKKMKVTDKQGNIYTFNDFESLTFQGSNITKTDNAWYVSKIKTKEGKEIKFTYETLQSSPSYNLYDYAGMPIDFYDGNYVNTTFPFGELKVYEGLKWFTCKLIKKIVFPSGYIIFTYDTRTDIYNDKKIVEISIYDLNNKLINKIKLNQDYFNTNFTSILTDLGEWQQNQVGFSNRQDYLNKRLKFTSIDFLDKDNHIINTQQFQYNDEYIPAKNSTAIDYWGYFNGVATNQNLFPAFSITVPEAEGSAIGYDFPKNNIFRTGSEILLSIPGANRDVNPLYTSALTLKKIVYPTKGSTTLQYENNTYNPKKSFVNDYNASKYSIYQNNNINGNLYNYIGGLRIKTILTDDNNGGMYKKDFNYHYLEDTNNDGIAENHSSGYLLKRPSLFDFRKKRSLEYFQAGNAPSNPDLNGMNGYTLIRNMALYENDYIGYENVEEVDENLITSKKIKKTYSYYISPTLVYNVYALGKGIKPPKPNFQEPMNFPMLSAFSNLNSFSIKPHKTVNNRAYFRDYTFDYKPFEVKDEVGVKNGLLKAILNYSYNNTFSLVSEENYDYQIAQKDLMWGCIYDHTMTEGYIGQMNNTNTLNPISNYYFQYFNPLPFINPYTNGVQNTAGYPFSIYNLIYRTIYPTYNPGASVIIKKQYLNGQVLSSKTENEYVSAFDNNIGRGNLLTSKVSYPDASITETKYQYSFEKNNIPLINANIVGIPLETKVVKKQNDLDSGKILSQIETKYNNLYPSELFPSSLVSYNIQNNNANTQITYDMYLNGNLQQYTTKEGIPVTLVWGYNDTKLIAKIEGITWANAYSTVLVTAIAKSNLDNDQASEQTLITALDNLRKNIAFSNTQITTYTYDPLIGITSITPPSGIREVYIYDLANRLKEIRLDNAAGKIIKEFKYNYKQ
ncbi:hypothetical protein [Chryseobacterium sp. 18068]|uniref:hypothetical protein n=1 Tax=Chryseobacterium sp. 18068 TaxID=2681414 RepID=UPI00135AD201|nr:hypothetical protein [Chryseobacterium sp. 18068]